MRSTPMPARERRDQFVTTAARLFRRQGFDSVSIDDIVEAIGVADQRSTAISTATALLAAVITGYLTALRSEMTSHEGVDRYDMLDAAIAVGAYVTPTSLRPSTGRSVPSSPRNAPRSLTSSPTSPDPLNASLPRPVAASPRSSQYGAVLSRRPAPPQPRSLRHQGPTR